MATSPPARTYGPERIHAYQRAPDDREWEARQGRIARTVAAGTGRSGDQPPRDDTERRVAALWADLLGVPVTDVNSDFFDMGGHSLLAARLIFQVQREFGVAPSLVAFLDTGRTVAGLAALIGTGSSAGTDEITSEPPLHFIFVRSIDGDEPETLYGAVGCCAAGTRADPRTARRAVRPFRDHRTTCQPDPFGDPQPAAEWSACAGRLLGRGPVSLRSCPSGCRCRPGSRLAVPSRFSGHRRSRHCCDAQLTLRWRLRRLRQRPARERWAKFAEVALRVLRTGELKDPAGFDLGGAAEIACRYRQPGHGVPMDLFVSEGSTADAEADMLGWDEFHRGTLTVHRLAGDHFTMLQLPVVEQLAQSMLESLRKARASRRI